MLYRISVFDFENLDDYLPSDSFTRIEIEQHEQAIAVIESVITSAMDKKSQGALQPARQLILDEYNIFELLARGVKDLQSSPSIPKISNLVTLKNDFT